MEDWGFWQQALVFMFGLLQRVCTHVRLGIFETSLCFYVCVFVEGIVTYKTRNYGN